MCLAGFSGFGQSSCKKSETSESSDNKDVLPRALCYKRVSAVMSFLYYLYICVYIFLAMHIAKIVCCFLQEHLYLLTFLS